MISDILAILKQFGLGAVGTFVGGVGIVKLRDKLDKKVFYEEKEKYETKFLNGSVKFAEIDTTLECLPEMKKDIKDILQAVARIEGNLSK